MRRLFCLLLIALCLPLTGMAAAGALQEGTSDLFQGAQSLASLDGMASTTQDVPSGDNGDLTAGSASFHDIEDSVILFLPLVWMTAGRKLSESVAIQEQFVSVSPTIFTPPPKA